MADATITKTIFLAAPRETVWSFLTESEKMAQWFHRSDRDLSDGQDYALLEKTDDGIDARVCWGTVLHMEAPSKLVYSFTIGPLDGAMTTVTWLLDAVGDGTRLTMQHEGLDKVEAPFGLIMALDKGWDEHLGRLRGNANPG